MKLAAALGVLNVASALAQCEAPVPCTDPTLLALQISDCQKHHIFVARGSDSGYPGHLGVLIEAVCESLEDCGYENVVYPANSSYAGVNAWCESAAIGAKHAQEQMTSYAEKCPDSKLIVMGYSQGASVVLDTLGGGGGPVFKCVQENNPALDRTKVPGSNIVAAIVFGAAVRTAGQSYTAKGRDALKGGQDFNGTSPRSEEHLAGLNPYADILHDYCNFGDPICAHGSEPMDVAQHLNYFKIYTEEAAKWVVGTVQGRKMTNVQSSAPKSSSVSSKGTPTATSSSTATSASTPLSAALSTSTPESKAVKRWEVFSGVTAVALGLGAFVF
ncbi:carbohydrate esterase family 5 protein [Pleomassaria siparia CBS 279.74]|uniref:Carbohydrate esterase family 5 protein n=1 Tax=Pleomassaria siparia CBS 279.74 TaxID=1314801 RepID=A0A6G1JSC6_9PLEO|nr:carbohydrate esterase family 5 protein [Pleomassaria siparia CBS 279.74]